MHHILYFSFFLLLTFPLFSQQKDFTFGLQVGNNYSRTIIRTEFGASPLRGDFFLGSSFGVVARSKLFKYKWEFGPFKEYLYVYGEYGVNVVYGGYNYYYKEQSLLQEQLHFQIPLLFVIRPARHKYWYRTFKGKRIYPIMKTGFLLSTTPTQQIQKEYTFGEALLVENITLDNRIQVNYVGALGFQKEFKNGKVLYMGFRVQTAIFKGTMGTIRLESPQINEIATLEKGLNFYSIDLQYFFGERVRNPKRGRLPMIIYNPRY